MATSTILHLGLGSFHRAHQAVYLQRLHDLGDRSWSIAAGNIRPDNEDVVHALAGQGCAYTVETVSTAGVRAHARIASIGRVLPWTEDLAGAVAMGAAPDTRIVSALPALFLAFLRRWADGAVPWTYQDQAMDPESARAMLASPDPVAALAAESALWGELAGDPRLEAAIRRASSRIANLSGVAST